MQERELIDACKREDRRAQQRLYDQYTPMMFAVCKRYIPKREDAEDVLVEGFFKVFANIGQFKGEGSFEGWIRRIIVNEALMFLRRRNQLQYNVEVSEWDTPVPAPVSSDLDAKDILFMLNQLPAGYRTVFNLYVIEGYKHREIADLLGISINTSKSQLILARKRLQAMLGMDQDEAFISPDLSETED
ncbi:MAG: ECF RNA polymerase sigma factor SigE [Haliscomenobacter sp.]|nr:ECF RNA polymerase sigma factor SigE [Haliscomenobacter sp.]